MAQFVYCNRRSCPCIHFTCLPCTDGRCDKRAGRGFSSAILLSGQISESNAGLALQRRAGSDSVPVRQSRAALLVREYGARGTAASRAVAMEPLVHSSTCGTGCSDHTMQREDAAEAVCCHCRASSWAGSEPGFQL
jgi:hypothetical protein